MGNEYLWEVSCCFKKVKGHDFNGNPFFVCLFFILLMRYHNEVFLLNDWHINPL